MSLNIKPIAKPQRPELVFRQRAGKKTPGLVPKLSYALIDQSLVDLVIDVHAITSMERMVARALIASKNILLE